MLIPLQQRTLPTTSTKTKTSQDIHGKYQSKGYIKKLLDQNRTIIFATGPAVAVKLC